jgi:hypothetical protein
MACSMKDDGGGYSPFPTSLSILGFVKAELWLGLLLEEQQLYTGVVFVAGPYIRRTAAVYQSTRVVFVAGPFIRRTAAVYQSSFCGWAFY